MAKLTVTDEQIRELLATELAWIADHPASAVERYPDYAQHVYAKRQAQVALGERRARRGSYKAEARARCAQLINARSKP